MAEKRIVNKLPSNAVWKVFDGDGEAAHFYHATGFPIEVYNPLLSKLTKQFKLSAMGLRATWPDIGLPPKSRSWQLYADDLIAFIEQQYQSPIVGIGHSIGATCTILAAEKRPDLFKTLVLIEPAMVSRSLAKLVRLMPKALMNHIEPAKSTLKKSDFWSSREEFLAYCKKLCTYKRFDDEAFHEMGQHCVVETQDGRFQLVFPKVWEAHSYTQPPNVMTNLEQLSMPCVAIRGKPSVFFTEALWQEWHDRCPDTVFKQNLGYGHLFPLESPSACYELIEAALSEIS
jgi:pimeloyl-ACP methyl ester carboxylesterase